MFNPRTLFVIGAGSGVEIDLPTGATLMDTIAAKLNIRFEDFGGLKSGDREIVNALRQHIAPKGIIDEYRHAAMDISEAMRHANSIDTFIDSRRGDEKIELCGKLAIVKSILEAERGSRFYKTDRHDQPAFDFSRLGNSWFPRFFRILHDGIQKGRVENLFDRISMINFNYDRCVEHYLVNVVQSYFALPEPQAQTLVRDKLRIRHPYGTVGDLPWQQGDRSVPFGGDKEHPVGLLALSQKIRTFTERYSDSEARDAMRDMVAEAEVIVFLGFGFHKQNMDLIKPSKETAVKRVYATAKDVSDDGREVFVDRIKKLIGKDTVESFDASRVHVRNDLGCAELFNFYSHRLSE